MTREMVEMGPCQCGFEGCCERVFVPFDLRQEILDALGPKIKIRSSSCQTPVGMGEKELKRGEGFVLVQKTL